MLVEGLCSEKTVNVYKISESNLFPEPLKRIETGCTGLTAAWVGSDRIYMAFSGSMEEPCVEILVFDLEYTLVKRFKLDDTLMMISSMALSSDGKYLVCAHL